MNKVVRPHFGAPTLQTAKPSAEKLSDEDKRKRVSEALQNKSIEDVVLCLVQLQLPREGLNRLKPAAKKRIARELAEDNYAAATVCAENFKLSKRETAVFEEDVIRIARKFNKMRNRGEAGAILDQEIDMFLKTFHVDRSSI